MQTTITKTTTRNIKISTYTTVAHLAQMLTAGGHSIDADSTCYIFHADGSYVKLDNATNDRTKIINSDRVIFTKADMFDALAAQKLAAADFQQYIIEKYA